MIFGKKNQGKKNKIHKSNIKMFKWQSQETHTYSNIQACHSPFNHSTFCHTQKKKPTQAKSPDVTHIKKTQYQNNKKKKEKKKGEPWVSVMS